MPEIGYKTYTPANYSSSEKPWELYSVDLQDVLAKAGNVDNFTFSNPFLPVALWSQHVGRFLPSTVILDNVLSFLNFNPVSDSSTNSGLLLQQDNGVSVTLQGNVANNINAASALLSFAPGFLPNIELMADDNENYTTFESYPYTTFNPINDFKNIVSLCIPENSPFQISDPYLQPTKKLILTMLVIKGDNQPFFTSNLA